MSLADQIIDGGPFVPGDVIPAWAADLTRSEPMNALRDELIELRQLRAAAEEMRALLTELVDPDPCWFDHNGGCQAHGYLSLAPGEKCPNERTKELLRRADQHTEECR